MRVSSVLTVLISTSLACAQYDKAMVGETQGYDSADYDMSEGAAEEPNTSGGAGAADADDGLGSETENNAPLLVPALTNRYVFVANPDRNTVTRIDVDSLQVITANVGVEPIVVQTSADYSKAVTFNMGSSSVSVIDANSLEVTDVDVRSNLNQLKMSPDGVWAICYHDLAGEAVNNTSGAFSYNAISIVNLENFSHFEAIAGSFPRDVQFTADSSMAVVISDDYLAVLDLRGTEPQLRRIAITDNLIHPPSAEEVILDPEGRYALIRQYGVEQLVLVDLRTEEDPISYLTVGANPTDMDISPDGTQAMVVARVDKEIWIYDLQDPTLAPEVLSLPESEVFGALLLSENGEKGVLYSTASGQSRIGIWDRLSNTISLRSTVKPVSAVEMSPNSDTAILFHPKMNGDVASSSLYYNYYALSLVDVEDGFSSAYRLQAEPDAFASSVDGQWGYYTMKDQPYLEIVRYQDFVPEELRLPSIPVHLGAFPESNTIYISQQHDLGRISFYSSEEQRLQTITGFELNAAIE